MSEQAPEPGPGQLPDERDIARIIVLFVLTIGWIVICVIPLYYAVAILPDAESWSRTSAIIFMSVGFVVVLLYPIREFWTAYRLTSKKEK